MGYKIRLKEQGNYLIEVLRKESHNRYHLDWTIDLGNDTHVICKQLYQNTKLIVYDWSGLLRIYDISTKTLLFQKDFETRISTGIKIIHRKGCIAIAYTCRKDKEKWLEVLSLDDYSTTARYELPRETSGDFFQLGINDEFLFYYNDNDDLGSTKWQHGYFKLDSETGNISKFPLPNPQRDEFEPRTPWLNPELRVGVMPCWDKVEIKQNEAGENLFVYKLSIFSLDDFSIINTFPVREFRSNELSCQDYYCEEMEEGLMKKEFKTGVYQEAQNDFIENLNSLVFDNETYTFWLCFRGGIMINVGYNGTTSAQFEPESHPGNICKGRDEFFHCYIHSWNKEEFILKEHWDLYRFEITEEDLKSTEKTVYKPLKRKEKIEVILSEDDKIKQAEQGKVVIEVEDLETPEGYLNALDQMVELTKDISAIQSGGYLIFRVKDKKGNVEQDDCFFKKAVTHPGAKEKINQVINQFVAYDRADGLYIDCETTALAYAVLELAKAGEEYAETAKNYFFTIDMEHDVFNQEELVPTLCELYPENPHIKVIDKFLREYHGCE
ncbi:hypothetical protein DMA11_12080 [Marinilabiliaceae bacterium JC017]|nr:hypothetical protein DMA11_12080 [Marinilabiliaceae bacterium JC017]